MNQPLDVMMPLMTYVQKLKEMNQMISVTKSTQCWCERTLSGGFSPLSAPLPLNLFFNTRSTPAHPIFRSLRSVFRPAHML